MNKYSNKATFREILLLLGPMMGEVSLKTQDHYCIMDTEQRSENIFNV